MITLDGSRLADFGSNNGVIVAPNNDMVSEVKVQSSNYAAEFGSAGVQVNAITKGGSSEFHGTVYDYLRDYQLRGQRPLELDRRASRGPKSKFQYPGGNLSGPILIPGTGFNKNRDKAFFFLGIEVPAPERRHAAPTSRSCPTAGQRNGHFNDYRGRAEPEPADRSSTSRADTPARAPRRPATTSRPTSTRWARC